MIKLMALARSLFLLFITAYLLWVLPLGLLMSSEAKLGNISVNVEVVQKVAAVAWLAVGWIALETALSWARVWAAGRDARKKAALAATAPSPAAPPAP
jgi:hypothetical protein